MKKKIISLILVVALTFGTYTVAAASNEFPGATRNSLKSQGAIVYQNGEETVILDSEDLYMLADQIDLLKVNIVNQLESMNTYFTKGDGISLDSDSSINVSHSKTDEINIVNPLSVNFDVLLDGIAVSQTIPESDVAAYGFDPGTTLYVNTMGELTTDSEEGVEEITIAPAESENLSAGTAAWVNGTLILGTGADNKSYYEEGNGNVSDKIVDIISLVYSGVNTNENYSLTGKNGGRLGVGISSKESAGPNQIVVVSDQIKVWDLEDSKKLLTKLSFNVTAETAGARDDDGSTSGSAYIYYKIYNQQGIIIGSGSGNAKNTIIIDVMSLPITTQYIYVEAVGEVYVTKSDHGCGTGSASIDFHNIQATYLIN